jgi:hypothetical protein
MKCLVLGVLVGCSTRSAPDVAPPLPGPAEAAAVTAAHGTAIELVGVTDDGRAAVTQDALGATRLWPSLDGTREPIVLPLASATQLVIGSDPAGFAIAALDEGGGAQLLRVAPSGAVLARASIAPDPPIESIAIAPQGVLALRTDQTLAILSASGEPIARLEGVPRSRMKHIVTRNGHTLVLLSHESSMYGRWLAGRQWGATTPDFMIDPRSRAMLSPNGERLLIDFGEAAYLLEVATGAIITNYGAGAPIGFVDDDTLVQLRSGKLVWHQRTESYGSAREETVDTSEPIVVGAGIAVAAKQGSLVLHARHDVLQLGYGITDVLGMHSLGNRVVVTGGQRAIMLDDSLDVRASFDLPNDDRILADVVPIDDQFAITTHTFNGSGWWGLSVIDLAAKDTQQATVHALTTGDIRYEPSTQLLAVMDKSAAYLTQWDATKQRFETWYLIAGGIADVHVLDPRLTDGIVAIALRYIDGGKLEVIEIASTDLKVGAPIEPTRHYFVTGTAVAVDKLGNVYVDQRGTFVAYQYDAEVMRIEDGRGSQLAAHPGGAYIALFAGQMLRLYDARGALKWETAAPLAQRIAWLGNDLVVDYAGGLGKIDAATGALIKRTCGWSFGLRALSSNDLVAGDSIFDSQ